MFAQTSIFIMYCYFFRVKMVESPDRLVNSSGKIDIKRRKYMAAVGMLGGVGLAGCTGGGDEGDVDRDTLNVAIRDSMEGMDSTLADLTMDFYALDNVVETLFRIGPDGDIYEKLATDVEILDDGERWEITLREGVMFHPPVDREMVADDVIANLDRVGDEDMGSPRRDKMEPLSDWRAIDDYTVELEFETIDTGFRAVLDARGFQVNARETIEDAGSSAITEPVGTGPFQFIEWEPREGVQLEAFEDYWDDDIDPIENVEITPITEPSVRVTELQNQDIDIDLNPDYSLAGQYEDNPDITLAESQTTLGRRNILVNSTDGQTDNRTDQRPLPTTVREIRQAIDAAIDREAMLETVDNGYGTISQNLYPADSPWGPDYEPFEYGQDLDRARELIEEADVPYDEPEITVITRAQNDPERQMGELLEDWLSEAGFVVDLQELETAEWLELLNDFRFDLRPGEGALFADPSPYINSRAMRTDELAGYHGGEDTNYEEVFDLWEQANATPDQSEREELYHEAQRLYTDDCSFIMCWHNDQLTAHRNDITGVQPLPDLRGQSIPNMQFD